jgi:hypothetical protein
LGGEQGGGVVVHLEKPTARRARGRPGGGGDR